MTKATIYEQHLIDLMALYHRRWHASHCRSLDAYTDYDNTRRRLQRYRAAKEAQRIANAAYEEASGEYFEHWQPDHIRFPSLD